MYSSTQHAIRKYPIGGTLVFMLTLNQLNERQPVQYVNKTTGKRTLKGDLARRHVAPGTPWIIMQIISEHSQDLYNGKITIGRLDYAPNGFLLGEGKRKTLLRHWARQSLFKNGLPVTWHGNAFCKRTPDWHINEFFLHEMRIMVCFFSFFTYHLVKGGLELSSTLSHFRCQTNCSPASAQNPCGSAILLR